MLDEADASVRRTVGRASGLKLKHHYQTGLQDADWIKCVHITSSRLIYAGIGQKVLVIDSRDGKCKDTFAADSRRHITCIYNCEKVLPACRFTPLRGLQVGYTILGCSDGSVELVNFARDMVQKFNGHTKSVNVCSKKRSCIINIGLGNHILSPSSSLSHV